MVAHDRAFTLRIVGTKGDVLVHNFIKPHDDDRLTIRTPAGTRWNGWAPVRPTPINWRRSPRMCSTARRCHSIPPTRWQNMAYIDAAYRAAGMAPR